MYRNPFLSTLIAATVLFSCNEKASTVDTTIEQSAKSVAASPQDTSNNPLRRAIEGMDKGMMEVRNTGDFDHDFAKIMIIHHQGAIDMSKVEIARGEDPELKLMAESLVQKQQEETRKLQEFMVGKVEHSTVDAADHNELGEIMTALMEELKRMPLEGDIDKDYAAMMVLHHKAGIKMAENEISHGKDVKLKEMAQKMMSDQTEEVAELEVWLKTRNH